MANRRMFSKEIIDSDMFLDMPLSTQALYFHLSMRADDDGFVNNPKKIQRMVGGSDDDVKILLAKKFVISFDSGIIVIKHWKIHNYIQKDRYKETNYIEEKALLREKENGVYTLDTRCIQNGDSGKVREEIGEISKGKEKEEFSFSLTRETQFENLSVEYKNRLKEEIDKLNLNLTYDDFVEGLMIRTYKYKNFLLAYQKWAKNSFKKTTSKDDDYTLDDLKKFGYKG